MVYQKSKSNLNIKPSASYQNQKTTREREKGAAVAVGLRILMRARSQKRHIRIHMAGPPTKHSRPCSDISRRSFFNIKKSQVPLSFQRLTITHLIIGVLKVEGSRRNALLEAAGQYTNTNHGCHPRCALRLASLGYCYSTMAMSGFTCFFAFNS
ncbi:hypothetical protein GOBAR_AA26692 [Gossypium barbadense]|uniref:Uncharacterized protein n=1 Tax=Gossypium barbadense TaxID=3634 RepID=A0A2P5WSB5_GOSBA|nr:hypothetical protein GOBAR_AA26692 [Gossypium barbadense]